MKKFQILFVVSCLVALCGCGRQGVVADAEWPNTPGNPYLPLWEHIPDGEPYVFEDPDNPGKWRVYIYGSHDIERTAYCGRDQVVWSAPVDSLNRWRYDGVILSVDRNANDEPINADSLADILYAPDVAMTLDEEGRPTYWLYPNDQHGGRNGLLARSSRPDGPFEVCNWREDNPNATTGVMQFDPAVLVDDDGRVYGYWGFRKSFAAELDPATMCTVLEGTQIVEDMVPGDVTDSLFRFFEASSIRKIKDKYVFIYSRWTKPGEFGLPVTNYTLAYAYSDHPLGPWTYGGTIIDGRGREINEQGDTIASATVSGNTHGSICQVGDQWYVFYHRHTGTDEYARQAMVAPITVDVEEGPGGRVAISEGEYTSEGFALDGLDPLEWHSAGIACWYTGPRPAIHEWPNKKHFGSYVEAGYGTDDNIDAPYARRNNSNCVVLNTDGSIVGYKYLNCTLTHGSKNLKLALRLVPEGVDGTITIMVDRPWTSQGGRVLGSINLRADMEQTSTVLTAEVPELAELTGKHALYLIFSSDTKERSMCKLEEWRVESNS